MEALLLSPDEAATNPRAIHLVEDDEEDEDGERSWKR